VGLTECALAMLRAMQWAERDADQAVADLCRARPQPHLRDAVVQARVKARAYRDYVLCHKCGNWKHEGHAPDCELAALIRDLREEVERG